MRHAAKVAILLLVFTAGAIAFTAYTWWHPVRTIDIKNFSYETPIHIETPVVHAGDIIRYQLQYCKYTDITPISKSQLIDGQIIPLTPSPVNGSGLPMGCHNTERDVIIPITVNPGRYYYNKELDYKVNALRTERVYYYTEYFQVVPRNIQSTSAPPQESFDGGQPPNPIDPSVSMGI